MRRRGFFGALGAVAASAAAAKAVAPAPVEPEAVDLVTLQQVASNWRRTWPVAKLEPLADAGLVETWEPGTQRGWCRENAHACAKITDDGMALLVAETQEDA